MSSCICLINDVRTVLLVQGINTHQEWLLSVIHFGRRCSHAAETWLYGPSSFELSCFNPHKYSRSQGGSKPELTERSSRVTAPSVMLKSRYLPGRVWPVCSAGEQPVLYPMRYRGFISRGLLIKSDGLCNPSRVQHPDTAVPSSSSHCLSVSPVRLWPCSVQASALLLLFSFFMTSLHCPPRLPCLFGGEKLIKSTRNIVEPERKTHLPFCLQQIPPSRSC